MKKDMKKNRRKQENKQKEKAVKNKDVKKTDKNKGKSVNKFDKSRDSKRIDNFEKKFDKSRDFKNVNKYNKKSDRNTDNKYSKYKDYKENKDDIKFQKSIEEEAVRLNKFIANSGVCSRRQADELIEKGLIKVNNEVVTNLGVKVKSSDIIEYKGKKLRGEKNIYIVMNKPKDYITTLSDPQNRRTVMDLFKGKVKERIYPVGRLDRNTSGVLLFTNDGDLTKKLTHPSKNIPKLYLATLNKAVVKNDIIKMVDGLELEDGRINVDAAYYYSDDRQDKVYIEIHSGRNRIVRRIFEYLNYEVKNLDRIEFSGINKKDLKRGQWRVLNEKEIGFLKMQVGKK